MTKYTKILTGGWLKPLLGFFFYAAFWRGVLKQDISAVVSYNNFISVGRVVYLDVTHYVYERKYGILQVDSPCLEELPPLCWQCCKIVGKEQHDFMYVNQAPILCSNAFICCTIAVYCVMWI